MTLLPAPACGGHPALIFANSLPISNIVRIRLSLKNIIYRRIIENVNRTVKVL